MKAVFGQANLWDTKEKNRFLQKSSILIKYPPLLILSHSENGPHTEYPVSGGILNTCNTSDIQLINLATHATDITLLEVKTIQSVALWSSKTYWKAWFPVTGTDPEFPVTGMNHMCVF